MICPNCTAEKMEERARDYHFTESGLKDVWLKDWPYFKCGECEAEMPLLPDPDDFAEWLVGELVLQKSRLNGDEIFFLRKAMGLTGERLANRLGVQRVEVSRWENDRNPISFQADFKLRMDAIEKLLPREKADAAIKSLMETLREYERDVRETRITVTSQVHRELVATV